MIYVIKRDGRQAPFDTDKIHKAILKAFKAVDGIITPYAETIWINVDQKKRCSKSIYQIQRKKSKRKKLELSNDAGGKGKTYWC